MLIRDIEDKREQKIKEILIDYCNERIEKLQHKG